MIRVISTSFALTGHPSPFPRLFLSAISSEPSLHLTVGESGMIGWQDERAGYKSPPAIIMTQGSTTVGKVPRPGDVGNPNRRRLRSHPDLRLIHPRLIRRRYTRDGHVARSTFESRVATIVVVTALALVQYGRS